MSDNTFKVVGVDLAAQPDETACCVIQVERSGVTARLALAKSGKKSKVKYMDATDDNLLEVFKEDRAARVGIDAPFGWPDKFIKAIARPLKCWPCDDTSIYPQERSTIKYRQLQFRKTDLYVWEELDKLKKCGYDVRTPPFSVSADKIGALAIRTAGLLARVRDNEDVDRSGRESRFVEVYPAAAFARWKIGTTNYKKNPWLVTKAQDSKWKACWENSDGYTRRMEILNCIERRTGVRMRVEDFIRTDHAVDALASALVTLMVHLDPKRTGRLIEEIADPKSAKTEGWIALPTEKSLDELRKQLKRLREAGKLE